MLGNIGNPRAVDPLIGFLKDQRQGRFGSVRSQAPSALRQIGAPAREPLTVALADTDPVVRKDAARTLGEIGDARAIDPLTAVVNDQDADVRKAAAEALDSIGRRRAATPSSAQKKTT